MPHVYSTLSCDQDYVFYQKGGGDMPVRTHHIRIRGGHGIADKRLVTPTGAVITEVTEEEAAQLETHELFVVHQKNHFVEIRGTRVDGEKVAADMNRRDGSAQRAPADYPTPDEGDVEGLKVKENAKGKQGK